MTIKVGGGGSTFQQTSKLFNAWQTPEVFPINDGNSTGWKTMVDTSVATKLIQCDNIQVAGGSGILRIRITCDGEVLEVLEDISVLVGERLSFVSKYAPLIAKKSLKVEFYSNHRVGFSHNIEYVTGVMI